MEKVKAKVAPSEDVWEDRVVGAEAEYVAVAPDISAARDAALDLHPVSIRLQRDLVEKLKALAQLHGLGYQPLMRQVLTRWVDSELKQMVVARANSQMRDEAEAAAARAEESARAVAKAVTTTSRQKKAA